MAEDETQGKKPKQGGLRTMPFILGNEVCDRFAAAGFNLNLVSYLTSQLHLSMVTASNTLNNFSGTSSLTTIIGALLADSYIGRFWSITIGSLIYQLGMITLTVSAILPGLRPPPCTPPSPCQRASPFQLLFLYASLALTCIGSGFVRPSVIAFGADQFELHKASTRKWNYFNLYYFALTLSLLLAITVVVYIQDNVGWGWGFGIPCISMFVAVAAFVIGYPMYIKLKPAGSPMTRLLQASVAAFRKRKVAKPEDPNLLFVDKELDAGISTAGRLLHSEQFRFLDQAAVITNGDIASTGKPNLWRLSTIHRVEELKSVIRLIPLWSVGIFVTTAASHNYTFGIMQAKSMDRRLTSNGFQVPAASMSIFSIVTLMLGVALYDRVFIPVARRLTGNPSGITHLQRIGIGLIISVIANVAAAVVEHKRRMVSIESGLLYRPDAIVPISVFWLVPQYAIHGFADAFTIVGQMEFLYDQSPESMRSTAVALYNLSGSIGNYLGTALATVVSDYTKRRGDWLQDNINRGRLDSYYWLVTVMQVMNLGYYFVCAKYYTFKPLEVEGRKEGDLELDAVEGKGSNIDGKEEATESCLVSAQDKKITQNNSPPSH